MSDDPIKDVLHMMPYGFYAVTSKNGNDVNAMVANGIVQVSFEPRLVAFGLQKTSYTHQLVAAGKVFAVNLFADSDEEAIKAYTKSHAKNPDKLTGVDYETAPKTGCPILPGAAAWFEVRVKQIVDVGGDHDVVIGEVVGAGVKKEMDVTDTLSLPKIGWSYAG